MARPRNMAVCRKLEQLIRSGRDSRNGLLPPERVLAARFGTGRSVIRSCLFELEERGIVKLVPARGWSIVSRGETRLERILVSVPGLLREKAWEQQAILASLCRHASAFFTEAVFSFLDPGENAEKLIFQAERGELQGVVFLERIADEAAFARLAQAGIPCVVVNQEHETGGVPSCGMDFYDIGYRGGSLLADAGHTRLGTVTGDLDTLIFSEMLRGFRDALSLRGIALPPRWIVGAGLQDEESPAVRAMLAAPDRPTAVFAMRDGRAASVFRSARELGLRVPEDLSVASYDDITWPGAKEKKLTTFCEDVEGMTRAAVEMLRDWNETGVPPVSRKIRAELIGRGSVTAPAAAPR